MVARLSHTDTRAPTPAGAPGRLCLLLFGGLFVVYSLNGREIGSYDTQPAKFLAREIVLRQTLTLDATVAAAPALGERPGFVLTEDGHYRSAYPLASALMAAVVAAPLSLARVVDLDTLYGPALVAKITASLLVALAVVLQFRLAARYLPPGGAFLLAVAVGLGTNYWALASQTLWQHESVALGLSGAALMMAVPDDRLSAARRHAAGAFLALAVAARPQVAPAVLLLALSLIVRRRSWRDAAALWPLALVGGVVVLVNLAWFGHVLGAMPQLEALHPTVHAVPGTWSRTPWLGAAGLLFSPSRGLLVFSPIVLVALAGVPAVWRSGWHRAERWLVVAAGAQVLLYASYSVWWGGFTYGPRYTLDLLPVLVPAGALGWLAIADARVARIMTAAALAWSLLVSGTGAWCYPNEQWNTFPDNVDVRHERLWQWSDPQFVRCWRSGASPQNWTFLVTTGWRPLASTLAAGGRSGP